MPAPVSPDRPVPKQAEALRFAAGRKDVAEKGRSAGEKAVLNAAAQNLSEQKGREALLVTATRFKYAGRAEDQEKRQTLTDFDSKGNRVARAGTKESEAFDGAKARREVYEEYLKSGFDGLAGNVTINGTAIPRRQFLVDQIEVRAKTHAGMQKALEGATPGSIDRAQIENLLRDPAFANEAAGLLNTAYDTPIDEAALVAATNRYKEAGNGVSNLEANEKTLSKEVKDLKDRKKAFESPGYTSTSVGFGTTREGVYHDLDARDPDVALLKARQKQYQQALASGDAGKIRTAYDNLDSLRTSSPAVQEYETLLAERSEINTGLQDKDPKLTEVREQLLTKRGELAAAKADQDAAFTDRQNNSVSFQEQVGELMANAAQEHVMRGAKEFLDSDIQSLGGLEESLRAEVDGKFNRHLQFRWLEEKTRTRPNLTIFNKPWKTVHTGIYELDRKLVETDIQAITEALKDAIDKKGDLSKLNDHAIKALKTSGIDAATVARIKANPQMMESMRSTFVMKTLAAYIGAGGTPSKELQNYIQLSGFGQDNATAGLVEKNAEAAAKLQELTGEAPSKESLEKVAQEDKKSGKKNFLLLLLLAIGLSFTEAEKIAGQGNG